jgi:predicted transcriptional regulator
MATLTSVNKEHLDNILDGIKTVEWRKKPLPLGKHYGYETKNKGGCGKVTGEFEVVRTVALRVSAIPHEENDFLARGCVPYRFLVNYARGAVWLYANVIENAKRYDKPKELSEFKSVKVIRRYHKKEYDKYEKLSHSHRAQVAYFERPPQSWCYVEELK